MNSEWEAMFGSSSKQQHEEIPLKKLNPKTYVEQGIDVFDYFKDNNEINPLDLQSQQLSTSTTKSNLLKM